MIDVSLRVGPEEPGLLGLTPHPIAGRRTEATPKDSKRGNDFMGPPIDTPSLRLSGAGRSIHPPPFTPRFGVGLLAARVNPFIFSLSSKTSASPTKSMAYPCNQMVPEAYT